MKIAITGGKGGTGKSMVATSLAVLFAKNKKTMLVDADAECPNDHLLLSITPQEHSKVNLPIPAFDLNKCTKCGKCAEVCQAGAISFVPGKYPAFVKDICTGCKACMVTCPTGAIRETHKEIGTIYTGENYGVTLITSELTIGELASGEVVADVRKVSDEINETVNAEIILIDSAAGIGCPVIASLTGTDYIVAVTEPTPSALHDLKRVLYLANHFKIKHGIVINKFDLDKGFCAKIEAFAKEQNIPIIGRVPYHKDFVKATIEMKPIVEVTPKYAPLFAQIIERIPSEDS